MINSAKENIGLMKSVHDHAIKAEQRIIKKFWEENLIPFCTKYKLTLCSGMGTWTFWKDSEIIEPEWIESKNRSIYNFMTLEPLQNTLLEMGAVVPDVNESDWLE